MFAGLGKRELSLVRICDSVFYEFVVVPLTLYSLPDVRVLLYSRFFVLCPLVQQFYSLQDRDTRVLQLQFVPRARDTYRGLFYWPLPTVSIVPLLLVGRKVRRSPISLAFPSR